MTPPAAATATAAQLLALAGMALVVLLAALGLAASASGAARRRVAARLAGARAAGLAAAPARGAERAPAGRAAGGGGPPWRRAAERCLGLSWELAPFYPMRWWLVPPVALAAARVACGLAEALLGPAALWATPAVAWLLCRWAYARFRARHRDALFRQFPDALGMIVRAVGVGVPPTEAVGIVAREALEPTAAEFRRVHERLALGEPLDSALAETAARNGVPEYRMFATALSLQGRTGGGLRESLETLAAVIRRRVSVRQRAWALAAEVRLSAAILAALPFVAGGLLALIDPGYVGVLFFDEGGRQILAAAAGLLLLGVLAMRETIRRALA